MPDTYATLTGLFTAIADALRARTGDEGPIAAQGFPAAIADLPAGPDTADATAAAGDILAGKTAYAGGEKLTGTLRLLRCAPIHTNVTGGYLYNQNWLTNNDLTHISDVYEALAGHAYVVGLGGTAGNKLRGSYLPTDPAGATATIYGSRVANDVNSPVPYSILGAICKPAEDGYIVIYKGNGEASAGATSLLLDVAGLS